MKIHFLRGVSGSGKSRKAWELAQGNADLICSADNYFMKEGKYCFDPALLPHVHGECLKKYISLVHAKAETIVVDNTNTQMWELKPYWEIAMIAKCDFEFIEFVPPADRHRRDEYLSLCARRNTHGVTYDIIAKQHERWQDIPLAWRVKG